VQAAEKRAVQNSRNRFSHY